MSLRETIQGRTDLSRLLTEPSILILARLLKIAVVIHSIVFVSLLRQDVPLQQTYLIPNPLAINGMSFSRSPFLLEVDEHAKTMHYKLLMDRSNQV